MSSGRHVGSIDLLKFLLAVCIVVLHCGQTYGGEEYLLRMGGIAVEVFFVISGYLMCETALRGPEGQSGTPGTAGEETVRFLWKKVRGLLVPYLVVIVIYLACWYRNTGAGLLHGEGAAAFWLRLLSFVPNLLLLSMAGILQDRTLMDITWYVSAMLLSMLAIYPLLRRFARSYTRIAAPLVSVLLMGYMYNIGTIYKGTSYYLTFMPQGLMRALIAVNLGCVAWELARVLRRSALTSLSRILLTLAAAGILSLTILVMQCGEERDCYALVLLFPALIGILFSGQMAGSALFDNRLCAFLGRASLYLYLYHVAVRKILMTEHVTLTYPRSIAVILTGAFVMFLVTELFVHLISRWLRRHDIRLSALFVRGRDT